MFLEVLQDFLYVFECSYVGSTYIYNVYVFLVDSSLEYYEVTFWISVYGPYLKSILSDMSIATPAFFPCPFAWKICFQPFTFSLCRSSVLTWVSCRQHMCGSCFLIHSAILCVLIGAFNHLHLRLLLIGTYSLPFFHTCFSLSLSLSLFLPFLKADPLASLAELVWWRCIL